MRKRPKGKLSRSRYVAISATLASASSDVQVLDAPQLATSPRPPENDETADVPELPDVPAEDAEGLMPQNRPTYGALPEWDAFGLHDQLMRALYHQSFTKPTPIQLKAIPPALDGRDVVGVAETVRSCLLPPLVNAYIRPGIGENASVWITCPTQAPLTEKASGTKNPQASLRVNPSPHS